MKPTPAQPPHAHPPSRWQVIVAGICALVLTVGLARFAYTPLLPIMREQAGLSYLAGGWLATINYAGYLSGALLAASIGDLQRKFVLYRLGLLLAVASTAAMGLTQSVPVWALLRYGAGVSSTAGMLLASGLALNWLIRHGHRPELGLHFTGLGLGIVVSGLAVAAMVDALRWDQQWLSLGLLGLGLLLPAWAWLPRPAAPAATPTAALTDPPPPSRRWVRLFVAAYFCAGFGFAISATFVVAILEKLPFFAGHGGWVWVAVGLAATPSAFVWDRAARALGANRALMLAFGLQTVSVLLPWWSDHAGWNLLGAVLFGGTFVGIVSLTLTLFGRSFPHNPAKAMARMTLSYGAAQIVAPALAGSLAQAAGHFRASLALTAAMLLTGMVLLRLIAAEERRAAGAG